ncbi:hypothetical protein CEXT_29271 [Caerostris extrusa]|uniref:Uncharacterized protein n=1 Tax=Caerostris extrusa TaxID=172846 RepID=A0AAV4Q9R0_CAEEX|nr:hypothetical protein CEXT_29271 [Caerostris extrusa]
MDITEATNHADPGSSPARPMHSTLARRNSQGAAWTLQVANESCNKTQDSFSRNGGLHKGMYFFRVSIQVLLSLAFAYFFNQGIHLILKNSERQRIEPPSAPTHTAFAAPVPVMGHVALKKSLYYPSIFLIVFFPLNLF